mgnify:CR=1 FL=1
MNRGLRWVGYGVALAAVAFAVVLASRFGTDPGLVDSPLLGEPAPAFELAPLEGGDPVALSDLSGDIVVVNFFANVRHVTTVRSRPRAGIGCGCRRV